MSKTFVGGAHALPPQRGGGRPWLLAVGGAVAAALAVGTLAGGVTLGLFSSTPQGETNTFTAGTVSLSTTASSACTVSNLMPGDAASSCTFVATYQSTEAAYLGLDIVVQTKAGVGGSALYDPGTGGVDITVTDGQSSAVNYTIPTTADSTSCPSGYTCYVATNELVSTSTFTNTSGAVTFTTAVHLPSSATNAYQGGEAEVILTAHAVQAKNNPLPGSCAAGSTCSGLSWS